MAEMGCGKAGLYIPVIFLAPPRRPSIAAPPPKVEGESCPPGGRQDEKEERSVGRGGKVDEQGVEGRRQAPDLVHLAHIASEQTKSKGGDGEDGAGNQGGL